MSAIEPEHRTPEEDKHALEETVDMMVDVEATMASAGLPPNYYRTFRGLMDSLYQQGYDRVCLLPCYLTDVHEVMRAVCIRCKVSREELNGHLMVLGYKPPTKSKAMAFITFVCAGCGHDKFVKEVLTLCHMKLEEVELLK